MEIKKTETSVYETQDYELFKLLNGNRDVRGERVKKIVKSIQDIGYILNPIIVNKNHEVIDGQHRLAALKELRLPVYYIIVDDAGIDECMAMNINQTNWNMTDYIMSYAKQGNENYVRLALLANEHPEFDYRTIAIACIGYDGGISTRISKGHFKLTEEQLQTARRRIAYLSRYQPYVSKMPGRKTVIYQAITWCFDNVQFDKDRLLQKFIENYGVLPPLGNLEFAIENLEHIYNYQLQGSNRVYFHNEWERKRREK